MARGITESEVHTAADEIVATGDRPTVERIRAHLGTGSPNTVTRWLETWWRGLGARLEAQQRPVAVPGAPEAVITLAGEWWGLALEHARASALETLAAQRAALQAEREALLQERARFAAEAAVLRDQVSAAAHAERLATTQATELHRLVSQLEGQVKEMARQRDAALLRATEADSARQAADVRIQTLQDAASTEREALTQHIRVVEDRAHAEIDHARQDAKELRARLVAAAQEHAGAQKSLLQTAEQAKTAAAEAHRDAGIERARADALEKQLAKLQELPAALEAAIRQHSKAPPKTRKTATRKPSENPGVALKTQSKPEERIRVRPPFRG
ncbi:DNA-binding protein [Pseudoxanthomonas putridarboris]|uniref:DNA-binding protein n=1 Tax=Pseudoxanthomonas putridarboris TaxID=752605 RepID=A0ABU9IZK2_9GAMM